jgi:predicted PurR-regulated permease PerM
MIDFHSHILPNVDDGSHSVEESIELLKMLSEVKELSGCVMGNGADIVNRIFEAAEELPILKDAERTVGAERIRVTVSKVVDGALSVMCQRIPSAVMGIMSSLPKVLLFSATLILATFYFGADVRRINSYIVSLFP